MTAADLLQRETKCAPVAVTRYLRGEHIPPRTRALLETARIRLGLPAPPVHERCGECVARERNERGIERRNRHFTIRQFAKVI